ncbi:hypothetical protein ACHAWO_006225 [Cyclotella atomus]|uniref:HEAT repeat-containing protein 3 n=1 Tax=Cyclotella atomus TaxID=382360 RepID=A0ABD3R3H7_9STRA
MGKQSKRKRQKAKRPTPSLSSTHATDDTSTTNENPILSKIRHGDARVRHAALVALSSTVYDSVSLHRAAAAAAASSNNNNGIAYNDPSLLRALSERLLDPDVPCAIIAAGCLSNYVSFGNTDGKSNSAANGSSEQDDLEVASQVLIPILIQRLSLGVETLSTLCVKSHDNSSSAKKGGDHDASLLKLQATLHEQWTLQSLALQTLAGLIENCPLVLQRMNDDTVLSLLLKVIACAVDCIDNGLTVSASTNNETDGGDHHPVLDAAMNSGRALHSLLDENVELIRKIPVSTVGGEWNVNTVVKELSAVIGNVKIGNVARLHCCGALLSLRKVLVEMEDDGTISNANQVVEMLQSCTNTLIVPTMHSLFSIDGNQDSPKNMVHRMMELYKAISSQRQDEAMESEVTHEINKRKEPARLIARRQKEMKAKKQEDYVEMQNDKKEGVVMVEDDASKYESSIRQEGEAEASVAAADPQDQLETIVQSWRNLVGSHKLALELVANLCSGPVEEDELESGMYDNDEDEHMWDSDDEAKLMETMGQSTTQRTTSPADKEVYNSIASHQLVEQILIFFNHWVMFLPSLGLGVDDKCPSLVVEDVDELLATCAVCLGNMIACEIPTWTLSCAKEVVSVVCRDASVENGMGLVWWSLVALLKSPELAGKNDAMNHITTIMLALLRHHLKTAV